MFTSVESCNFRDGHDHSSTNFSINKISSDFRYLLAVRVPNEWIRKVRLSEWQHFYINEITRIVFWQVWKSAIIAHHFHKHDALILENGGVPILPIFVTKTRYVAILNCTEEIGVYIWIKKMGTTLKQYRFTMISGNLFYSGFDQLQTPRHQGPPTDNHTCSGYSFQMCQINSLRPHTKKSSFS